MITYIHQKPGFLEKSFVVIALLFYSNAFISLLEMKSGIELMPGKSDFIMTVISYSTYVVTACLLFGYLRDVFTLVGREKFMVCMLGLAFLSTIWSDLPLVTLRRSMGLVGTTSLGVYLTVRYPMKEQLQLLAVTFGIAAILSLLVAILLPSYGVMSEINKGCWRGIFDQKNELGRFMTLGFICFALVIAGGGGYRPIKWIFLSLCLGLLLLSRSKTSLAVLLIIVALVPFYKSLQWHINLKVSFYCIAAIIAITMLLYNKQFILHATNRDLPLTGRLDIWEAVLNMIKKRPILGYGYNAFWLGLKGKSTDIWSQLGWITPHAHNGFLDLWLDLGLLGILIFTLGFLQAVRNGFRKIYSKSNIEAFWPIIYLTYMLWFNLTESTLLKNNSIYWVLYASVITSFYFTAGTYDNVSYELSI